MTASQDISGVGREPTAEMIEAASRWIAASWHGGSLREHLPAIWRVMWDASLCDDCPPVGYPTDKTRCLPCPRRASPPAPISSARQGVVQADRDGAADLLVADGHYLESDVLIIRMRAGEIDDSLPAQAFRNHRLATEEAVRETWKAGTGAAIEALVTHCPTASSAGAALREAAAKVGSMKIGDPSEPLSCCQEANLDGWNHAVDNAVEHILALSPIPMTGEEAGE